MKTDRFDINAVVPGAYKSLIDLDNYVKKSGLPENFYHLIKVRASLLNGCAYCIQSHTNDALSSGEPQKKITALSAWKDSPYFTRQEQAILALTDETTLISQAGVSDQVFNNAVELLGKENVSFALLAISCINAWNRIGRSTLLIPE